MSPVRVIMAGWLALTPALTVRSIQYIHHNHRKP